MRARQRGNNNKQRGNEPKCKKKKKKKNDTPKCIKPNTNLAAFTSPQLGVLQNPVYTRKGFDRMLCTEAMRAQAGPSRPACKRRPQHHTASCPRQVQQTATTRPRWMTCPVESGSRYITHQFAVTGGDEVQI